MTFPPAGNDFFPARLHQQAFYFHYSLPHTGIWASQELPSCRVLRLAGRERRCSTVGRSVFTVIVSENALANDNYLRNFCLMPAVLKMFIAALLDVYYPVKAIDTSWLLWIGLPAGWKRHLYKPSQPRPLRQLLLTPVSHDSARPSKVPQREQQFEAVFFWRLSVLLGTRHMRLPIIRKPMVLLKIFTAS